MMKIGNSDLINVSNEAIMFKTTAKAKPKHRRNTERIKGNA